MPADQGKDEERFAAAIEQGRPPGSVADAGLARDLEIAAMLRARRSVYTGGAFDPTADEKARARQRLMAMLSEPAAAPSPGPGAAPQAEDHTAPLGRLLTPQFPAGDDTVTAVMPAVTPAAGIEPDDTLAAPGGRAGRRAGRHTMPSRPSGRPGTRVRSTGRSFGRRVLLVGTAALVALAAIAGGGVFASRNALPGDALYGVKRAAESAGLAMTFDDMARAQRQLELATTRLDEVERLVADNPDVDPQLVSSAIQDFDTSAGSGSRMLMSADDAGGAAALGDLRAWAGEQVARLSVLRSALPATAVPGADSSISLMDRLLGRTEALSDRSSCTEVTSGTVDDLGPLPAQGTCSPRPVDPESTSGTGSTSSGTGDSRSSTSSTEGDPDAGAPSSGPGSTGAGTDKGEVPAPSSTAGSPTTTPAPGSGGNNYVPLPLPLLPPMTLPPLRPGQPGITLGG